MNDAGHNADGEARTTVVRAVLEQAADRPVSIDELAAMWRIAHVLVRCSGAGGIAGNPNAPAEIRGAWGRALGLGASDAALSGRPCSWSVPCAYDLFFNPQGRQTAGLELPKPFVFALERDGRDLRVMLSLFGIACDWAGEAADALVRALRDGLDGRDGRRSVAVDGREIAIVEGVDVPDLGAGALLDFRSRLVLRRGQEEHADPASLITSLANRIGGLARWHGVAAEIDDAALASSADRIARHADWVDPDVLVSRRGSQVQGRQHEIRGVRGVLRMGPVDGPIAAILALGATCHAGGRTALGEGRYLLHRFAST